jgi:hypothetical protein
VVGAEPADEAIIVEGIAEAVTDLALRRQFAEAYGAKYQWDMEGFTEPIYAVRPAIVFAFIADPGKFTGSATRWIFEED